MVEVSPKSDRAAHPAVADHELSPRLRGMGERQPERALNGHAAPQRQHRRDRGELVDAGQEARTQPPVRRRVSHIRRRVPNMFGLSAQRRRRRVGDRQVECPVPGLVEPPSDPARNRHRRRRGGQATRERRRGRPGRRDRTAHHGWKPGTRKCPPTRWATATRAAATRAAGLELRHV